MNKRLHVFISHHHADDDHVTKLTELLAKKNMDVRNSSIRAKPANQERLDKGLIPERTLKRLLRMKISWASTFVVLIGKDTHKRPWVDWEIRTAAQQGKRIVGVYTRGGTEQDKPKAFEEFGSQLRAWNTDSIIDAIEGGVRPFETPDGAQRAPTHTSQSIEC